MKHLALLLLLVAGCKSAGSTSRDLAVGDLAAPADLVVPDLAPPTDLTSPPDLVPRVTGCLGLIDCTRLCAPTDDACFQTCFDNSTTMGQELFGDLFLCLDDACPSTGGAICDMASMTFDMTKCQECYTAAQMKNAMCYGQLLACVGDP